MMTTMAVGTLIGGLVVGGIYWTTRRSRRHRALRKQHFPEQWEDILKKHVGHYEILPANLRRDLQGHIQIFLDEKSFEGCGGLEVTDEMKVTIAGLASMLLLNRKTHHYPDLNTILIYPRGYKVDQTSSNGITVAEEQQGRLGESWDHGTVVLSWSDVTHGAHNIEDGHNLALHEFAHQLDQEHGVANGVPLLERESRYTTWAKVLSAEFERHQKRINKGKRTVIDGYGATNPAEFFAVTTETFFEKPHQLKSKHPELYAELKKYYHLDPAEWTEGVVVPEVSGEIPAWVMKGDDDDDGKSPDE